MKSRKKLRCKLHHIKQRLRCLIDEEKRDELQKARDKIDEIRDKLFNTQETESP